MGWSYSSLKTFQQCPKKYYHIKVAKDVENAGGAAADYGKKFHEAAEFYIRDSKPLPKEFKFAQKTLDTLNKIPGKKYCEIELGITKNRQGKYISCDFDDPNHWWHGIADLLIIDGGAAYLVDYKTSKNAKYADTKQLDLLAAGVFLKFPYVLEIKSALAFVISNEFITKEHYSFYKQNYLEVMKPELDRLEAAMASKIWNPVSGPLCKFCPVTSCAHHKG
jgi:ATP-dependent exoDNAse (exonuclease V) beta subunit